MASDVHVYLVPGFFGFDQIGSLSYFQRVTDVLDRALKSKGVDATLFEVATQPTSSIRRRALRLLNVVRSQGGLDAKHLHFVGHSTGGLDVRLLLTPGVRLDASTDEEQIGDHARSATLLSTPHFGTPLANFFTSMNGRYVLYVLTLLATSAPGRVSVYALAQLMSKLAHYDDILGRRGTALDHFAERLLKRITHKSDHEIYDFLRAVASDQGAMIQLTPEAIDLFNAAVADREATRYVSFVTAAPPPSSEALELDPYRLMTHLIFRMTYAISAREHRHYPYPYPGDDIERRLQYELPVPLSAGTNDGMVPTLSQVWGRLGGVYVGDHLDVVGQFPHRVNGKDSPGWLHSGARFSETMFQKLWGDIADVIARTSR
ncbi:MAG: hypothetical protein MJD61_22485 [Proteobacteria bacterium]|nr:hypothetical protein [Pseudomonadota bacterium]